VEIMLGNIIKVKQATELRTDQDENGETVQRLITKYTIEAETEPKDVLHLLRSMRAGIVLDLSIRSPQSEMDLDMSDAQAVRKERG